MSKFNLSIAALLIFIFGIADLSAQTRITFARGKSSTIVLGTLSRRDSSGAIKKFSFALKPDSIYRSSLKPPTNAFIRI